MKHLFLFVLGIFGITASYAQPSLTNIFNYKVGDEIHYLYCDTAISLQYADTGVGKMWQFRNLAIIDSYQIHIAQTSNGNHGGQFPAANYVMQYSDGSEIYITRDTKGAYAVGAAKSGQVVSYTNPMLCAEPAFGYKSISRDTFTTKGAVSGLNLSGMGYIVSTGEAAGTLVLPNGTYNDVLKIKTVTLEYDTLTNMPAPNVITSIEVSYSWYDAAHPAAVLTIDSVTLTSPFQDYESKTIAYLENFTSTGISKAQAYTINMTCHLDDNGLIIHAPLTQGEQYVLKLFNSTGQLVAQTNFIADGNIKTLSCPDLPNGFYTATLISKSSQAVCKVIK